jgi:hypothetical protein
VGAAFALAQGRTNYRYRDRPAAKAPKNGGGAHARVKTVFIMFHSLNHLISKSSINFVHNLSLFDNELIKHKSREEQNDMHEIQN